MTTRISHGPVSAFSVAPTHRVTPKPSTPFKSMLNASSLVALSDAESALGTTAAACATATSPTDREASDGSASAAFASRVLAAGGIADTLARQSREVMAHLNLQLQDDNHRDTTLQINEKPQPELVESSNGNQR